MRSTAVGGLLALGLFLAPGAAPVDGQVVTVTRSGDGWVGIRFDLDVRRSVREGRTVRDYTMVITDVLDDSPAERAGILPGDTVTRIDGRRVFRETLETLGSLEPGEEIGLTLRRGGRSLEVEIVAGRRPHTLPTALLVRVDSIEHAIVARMDSARVSLRSGRLRPVPDEPGVVRIRDPEFHLQAPDSTFAYRGVVMPHVSTVTDPTEPVPLEHFLFHSEATDSARRELARLQRELQRVNEAETRRLRELADEMARARREIDQNDTRLRELREQEARLQLRMARARQEMERAQLEARRRQAERARAITEMTRRLQEERTRRTARQATERGRAVFRPLSVYVAGENMLAGARLTELNAALAEYFDVERGVLVTEVLDGTPAADAPLVAGDVIVRVGEVPVDDLAGLRTALARSREEIRLDVVRKGRRLAVTIPRE